MKQSELTLLQSIVAMIVVVVLFLLVAHFDYLQLL